MSFVKRKLFTEHLLDFSESKRRWTDMDVKADRV